MSQLLLELFCEEIPARMQARASADLLRMLVERLKAAGLAPGEAKVFAGPRRLTAVIEGLDAKSPDVSEERKGPRVGAPEKAIAGFLRGAGLDSLDACQTREDKKGSFYVAVIDKPGRATPEIVAEAVTDIVRTFPWPKSQRWGSGTLRWVRPLHRVLCVFDGAVVPFEIDGIVSGDETEGHRMLGRGPFKVRGFDDYVKTLRDSGHVVLDAAERREIIANDARRLCKDAGLELVEDEGLLAEVAGLVEWPVVLLGDMDPSFLDLPPEVIRLTMRTHQKYFAVRDPKTGDLAHRFVVVANQTAPDGGVAIAQGNARVLSARLNDARYFWDNDRKTSLDEMAGKLGGIVFHAKLGTVADKVERVAKLARELAPKVGADPDLAERAARLAKADLVSEMVTEFPELQGVMGRYYALQAPVIPSDSEGPRDGNAQDGGASASSGRDPSTLSQDDRVKIADAIRDHYKPQGPSDSVPTEPVAIAVALADKFDTLAGFWAINHKPTGSKDPFALRRAALGVVRITVECGLRISCIRMLSLAFEPMGEVYGEWRRRGHDAPFSLLDHSEDIAAWARRLEPGFGGYRHNDFTPDEEAWLLVGGEVNNLLDFFADRLKVHLRDEGHRHDLVDAVFALGEDDLVLIVKRVEALGHFLDSDDGKELLAGYKRAANILRIEEKKDETRYSGAPDAAKFQQDEERALFEGLTAARATVEAALKDERFEDAMAALAPLRGPVDAFFDAVTVNAEDSEIGRAHV